MSDHWYLFVHETFNQLNTVASTLELDGLCTAIFHQPQGVFDAVVLIYVISPKRHIGDHHCPFRTTFYGYTGRNDLVQRNRYRIAVSVDDIAHTVTDQDHV